MAPVIAFLLVLFVATASAKKAVVLETKGGDSISTVTRFESWDWNADTCELQYSYRDELNRIRTVTLQGSTAPSSFNRFMWSVLRYTDFSYSQRCEMIAYLQKKVAVWSNTYNKQLAEAFLQSLQQQKNLVNDNIAQLDGVLNEAQDLVNEAGNLIDAAIAAHEYMKTVANNDCIKSFPNCFLDGWPNVQEHNCSVCSVKCFGDILANVPIDQKKRCAVMARRCAQKLVSISGFQDGRSVP